MFTQKDFTTWGELDAHVQDLVESNKTVAGLDLGHFSKLLFRGQASYGWSLESTLERAKPLSTDLLSYYRVISIAKNQVETFTNRRWDAIDHEAITKSFGSYDALHAGALPVYDYLVYLRHHGFPSPLLDWSRSLYIAAFFACQEPKSERVAIFAYQEFAGSGKLGSSDSPQIVGLGPNVRSHPRHFLQQGEYTMCCQFIDGTWHSQSHSSVFAQGTKNQDHLWKFTLPASEARSVMKRLDEYNINSFSLFQSEESLLETLARRLIPAEP